MIYLVPTPLGNLKDITLRAIEILREADLILCEDTRTSKKLLDHYEIHQPLSAYHQHNEHKVTPHLVEQILAGKKIALITDAGTPGISDPGFLLVRACIQQGIAVSCLPGPTAFVPALVNSGLPAHHFCFEGFLPLKKGRQTTFKKLAREERTMIFYESPVRLVRTLRDMIQYLGENRQASVSRELSKLFEETRRGSLQELHQHFSQHPPKGEIVLVVAGNDSKDRSADTEADSPED
ncbi:MAG: 16S rRNA (cytidine(1402)-2'-O)-methyltransferase [Bacteroidota bacterium]